MKTIIILLALCGVAYAGNIPEPPVSDDMKAHKQYEQTLYNNFNNLTVTATAPNAVRNGKKGDMVLYNNAGTLELWVNTDNAKTWQKV